MFEFQNGSTKTNLQTKFSVKCSASDPKVTTKSMFVGSLQSARQRGVRGTVRGMRGTQKIKKNLKNIFKNIKKI